MLFNFEGSGEGILKRVGIWGCSSAGRASALHAEGQEFDPPHLHQQPEAERKQVNRPRNMGA